MEGATIVLPDSRRPTPPAVGGLANLPDELLYRIYMQLDVPDIMAVSRVRTKQQAAHGCGVVPS